MIFALQFQKYDSDMLHMIPIYIKNQKGKGRLKKTALRSSWGVWGWRAMVVGAGAGKLLGRVGGALGGNSCCILCKAKSLTSSSSSLLISNSGRKKKAKTKK